MKTLLGLFGFACMLAFVGSIGMLLLVPKSRENSGVAIIGIVSTIGLFIYMIGKFLMNYSNS